jgi:hypothetical protein
MKVRDFMNKVLFCVNISIRDVKTGEEIAGGVLIHESCPYLDSDVEWVSAGTDFKNLEGCKPTGLNFRIDPVLILFINSEGGCDEH